MALPPSNLALHSQREHLEVDLQGHWLDLQGHWLDLQGHWLKGTGCISHKSGPNVITGPRASRRVLVVMGACRLSGNISQAAFLRVAHLWLFEAGATCVLTHPPTCPRTLSYPPAHLYPTPPASPLWFNCGGVSLIGVSCKRQVQLWWRWW